MKILCVSCFYKPAFVYGGPSRSIPALCEGLAALGNQVEVFTTNANGPNNLAVNPAELNELNGVLVRYFNRDVKGNFFYSRELGETCYQKVNTFDLIYINSNWGYPLIPASRSAYKFGIPYIIAPRTSFMYKTWKGKYLKKYLYFNIFERDLVQKAAALHYTTELERKESDWLKVGKSSFVIPNCVALNEFDNLPERGCFQRNYGIEPGTKLILFLGRIEMRKGLDISLSAFSKFIKKFPNSIFVIAGPEEDRYVQVLKDISIKLNIQNRVLFTGYLNQLQRLEALVDSDIFILTSYSENFGMAVVEAMASGLPVLVSNQVGLADHIAEENAGIIAPLDDEIVAEKLVDFFGLSTESRFEMSQNALRASKKYLPSVVAEAMFEKLEAIARNIKV